MPSKNSSGGDRRSPVTIREVARRAEVSIATVSRVLNHSKPVSEELKRRIEQAVREMGYLPNAVAQSMIQKRTGLIGVIVPEISNPYFSGLVEGIESVAHQHQSHIMLAISQKDPRREMDLLRIFQARQMDGIILAAARIDGELRRAVASLTIPYVLIGQRPTGLRALCIQVDNRRAAGEVIEHLMEKGHRRIGMISGPMWDLASGRERYEGYRDALWKAGKTPRPEWIAEEASFRLKDGVKGMEKILRADEPPTAVFCACDRMAVGAFQALESRGVRVPEQIAVAGFDDEEVATLIKPRLTTVRHSPFEMGRKATEGLMSILQEEESSPDEVIQIGHEPVVRESTTSVGE